MHKEGFWWRQVQPSYGAGGLGPLARTLIPINRTQSPALPLQTPSGQCIGDGLVDHPYGGLINRPETLDDLRLKFSSSRARLGEFAPPHLLFNCCTLFYELTCLEAMCYRVAPVRSWLSIPLPYSWRFALPPGQGPVE